LAFSDTAGRPQFCPYPINQTASINVRRREQLRRTAGNRFASYRTPEGVPDKNESKRKGERMCANFAHARRQAIETPALSVHSIMGAIEKRYG
jgi:hypothetical protein